MLLKSLEEEERLCVQHSDVDTGRCTSSSSTSPSSSSTAVGYSLKELNLSNTCIDKRCSKVVAEIIQRFSLLEELILKGNDSAFLIPFYSHHHLLMFACFTHLNIP